jgi:hypothetical protein
LAKLVRPSEQGQSCPVQPPKHSSAESAFGSKAVRKMLTFMHSFLGGYLLGAALRKQQQ